MDEMEENENLISISIGTEAIQNIMAAIKVIKTNLPDLVTLNDENRFALPKMGDKTMTFVTVALEQAEKNPSLVPSYIDVVEFRKDIEAVKTLHKLARPLRELCDELEDSTLLAGSEAYMAALTFYNAVKGAVKENVEGAEQVFEDMQQALPGKGSRKML